MVTKGAKSSSFASRRRLGGFHVLPVGGAGSEGESEGKSLPCCVLVVRTTHGGDVIAVLVGRVHVYARCEMSDSVPESWGTVAFVGVNCEE